MKDRTAEVSLLVREAVGSLLTFNNLDRTANYLGSVDHFLDRTCAALSILAAGLLERALDVFALRSLFVA